MIANLYDFDDTIYDGNSSFDFYFFCLRRHPALIKYIFKLIVTLIKRKRGSISRDLSMEILFSYLESLENVDEEVRLFWEVKLKKIKEFYRGKEHGSDIIISASPYFLLEPIKELLGVRDVIATEMDKKTGRMLSLECYGGEKVRRLVEKYGKVDVIESYSDSLSDVPILLLAKRSAYLVKGDKLVKYVEDRKEK